ncbi:bifunctional riboflavin kinase/FAD synthetase [Bacillus sp. FJAT-45037]|uniref:bifunctional riboflavin kinase/FAD synthetase n=1 Tax=Bacillus sp. FJAT-45037 TaxID=2011007 RepID=UPI000C248BAE|nr:bifunctional riboflavin kinase/FAD synthetase [Bacillus sp. FJAT-45037]
MDTIYLHHPIEANTLKIRPTVLALGYFDGVHLGHQEVINQAIKKAAELGVQVAVMTFDPHPKEVLRKNAEPMRYITPLPQKEKKIAELNVDVLYVVNFTKEFATLTPQQYVDQYIIALGAVHVVAGFDFTYGALGKGTMETLMFHSRGEFEQTTVQKVEQGDVKISSTKIRELLETGEVSTIPAYLGEHYAIFGKVVDGDKRGRTIGFPTANVEPTDRAKLLKTGVYAVRFETDNASYKGVCNVGYKPTFNELRPDIPTIEVHIFDFDGDLYGQEVTVYFEQTIRPEQKFSSKDELIKQIHADKQVAFAYFAEKSK